MKRSKTLSKNWYDDEILFIDQETGDIHLKPGVHRLKYNTHINPDELECHINYWDLGMRKVEQQVAQTKNWD